MLSIFPAMLSMFRRILNFSRVLLVFISSYSKGQTCYVLLDICFCRGLRYFIISCSLIALMDSFITKTHDDDAAGAVTEQMAAALCVADSILPRNKY